MISVLGDIMLDKYLYGSSTRMSPECESAPVVSVYQILDMLGGASNTALNIQHLDAPVKLYTALSTDNSSELKNLLIKENIRYDYVLNHSNKDVTKVRVYSNGAYVARVDYDDKILCDSEALYDMVLEDKPELLVLSDYNKGTIIDPEYIINNLNAPVLVDPKQDLTKYRNAFVLKPNLKEFLDWSGETNLSKNSIISVAQELNINNLIVTNGSKGCTLATKTGFYKEYPALKVNTVDVTGAGDSFLAAIATALYEKKTINKAIEFAIKVAAIAVTKKGTAYVKRNEI